MIRIQGGWGVIRAPKEEPKTNNDRLFTLRVLSPEYFLSIKMN